MAVPDNTSIPAVCFRAYDIRGRVAPGLITAALAYDIGLAIGAEAHSLGITDMLVARDGRLSGPALCQALVRGLLGSGLNVTFLGVVPTPVLYFATQILSTRSGVMVTASHNPGDHNGFKIVLAGETLSGQALQRLYQRICLRQFVSGSGIYRIYRGIVEQYVDYVVQKINIVRPLKVVLDCGSGVAGVVAPLLFRRLGCEVIELFCECDGVFPYHHPDPSVSVNLVDLIERVRSVGADMGLAFDGDGDRLGVVTNAGHIIWPDRQMMLFAIDVLKNNPGAPIIFDVKCSRYLADVIRTHGGKPLMWSTGHSLIKAKALECQAPLAGELSGHIFFRDDWFGFDDGMYVGARLLQIIARSTQTSDQIFSLLPNGINTPELQVSIAEDQKASFMQRFIQEADFSNARLITQDGIRVEYPDGWVLVRASNTLPCLTIRFEGDNLECLQKMQEHIRQQIYNIHPTLEVHW